MLNRGVRLIVYGSSLVFLILLLFQSCWYQTNYSNINLEIALKSNTYSPRKVNLLNSPDQSTISTTLTTSVVKNVQRFLFFVGYARSGHSIMASMLDAHPNIVIAHEYSLFSKWNKRPQLHSDKKWLFNTLLRNSRHNSLQGLRTRHSKKKGYTLAIPGGWQGQFNQCIHVIGDKAGGMTAQVYRKNHTLFVHTYRELQRTLNIPIHVIHIIRNPYDNIATMLLYSNHKKQNVSTTNKYDNHLGLKEVIVSYFKQVRSVMNMIKNIPLKVIEIHSEDLISDPKNTVRRICNFLHVECSSAYLQICANSIYTSESRSRDLVHWTNENVQLVEDNIQNFSSLKRYTFLE